MVRYYNLSKNKSLNQNIYVENLTPGPTHASLYLTILQMKIEWVHVVKVPDNKLLTTEASISKLSISNGHIYSSMTTHTLARQSDTEPGDLIYDVPLLESPG